MLARRQPLEPYPVEFNQLVGELVRLLERLMKGVTLHLDLDAGTGTVMADPGQLEQVVLNLVLNARDAMPDGGSIRIHAGIVQAAEHHGPPGAFVRIDVCDSGVGIASTDRERIFEPFYSTKPSGSGSGLGLASVRRILDRAGGFVRVESHVGVGTTLSIFLPRVSGDG
jgi:signal transduction histidine kinase